VNAAQTSTYYDTLDILFPGTGLHYMVSDTIQLTQFSRIYSAGAVIEASSTFPDGSPILKLGTNTIQTDQTCVIRGLVLDGGAKGATLGSATVIGLEATIGAAVILDNVVVQNCWFGFFINGLQFCTFRNCKAYYCSVGFFNLPQVSANNGGNNSNSYYDIQGVQCIVGFLLALPPPDSQIDGVGNNILYNPSMEECAVCGYAFIGQSPAGTGQPANYPQGNVVSVDIIEGASESTNNIITSPTNYSFTYPYGSANTYSVPNIASIYMSYANVTAQNFACVEHPSGQGATNWASKAAIQVNNNSSLYYKNSLGGPSIPSGEFMLADTTSQIILDGTFIATGTGPTINGISKNNAAMNGYGVPALLASPSILKLSSTPNNTLNPILGDGVGAASPATLAVVANATGVVSQVASLTADIGAYNSNCLYFPAPNSTATKIGCVSLDIVSSTDRQYRISWYISNGYAYINLKAGVKVRLFHMFPNYTIDGSTGYWLIYPNDRTGLSTLSISNIHTFYSATDDSNARAIINQIASGAFNNKMSLSGYGAPASLTPPLVAPNGAIYTNQNGGTDSRLYVFDGVNTWNSIAGV
jgi:hypothetical protein